MDFRLKDKLELNGFDVDKGIATFFNDDDLYIEALKKFVDDGTVDSIIRSSSMDLRLGLSQATKALTYVDRLGLVSLHKALEDLCVSIRNGLDNKVLNNLKDIYANVKSLIQGI